MRLHAQLADITTLKVDAIVNAANESLAPYRNAGITGGRRALLDPARPVARGAPRFLALRGARRASGPSLATCGVAARAVCGLGRAHRVREHRLPAHAARDRAPPEGRRRRLRRRLYRPLHHRRARSPPAPARHADRARRVRGPGQRPRVLARARAAGPAPRASTRVVRRVLLDVALGEVTAEGGRLLAARAERDLEVHHLDAERGAHGGLVEVE